MLGLVSIFYLELNSLIFIVYIDFGMDTNGDGEPYLRHHDNRVQLKLFRHRERSIPPVEAILRC